MRKERGGDYNYKGGFPTLNSKIKERGEKSLRMLHENLEGIE
jgi:hypothetical protein